MKFNNLYIVLFVLFISLVSAPANGQSKLKDDIRIAIKSGSSKALLKHLNDIVELKIDNKDGSYSKTQSEFALKDFFKKHPPTNFSIVHEGESKSGSKFFIGTYNTANGNYRVYLKLVKKKSGKHLIDTIDFSKE